MELHRRRSTVHPIHPHPHHPSPLNTSPATPVQFGSMTLVKPASGSGGDKYSIVWDYCQTSTMYVPQVYRKDAQPQPQLSVMLYYYWPADQAEGLVEFRLAKKAALWGDDHYSPVTTSVWKHDIVLPKEMRKSDRIWIRVYY